MWGEPAAKPRPPAAISAPADTTNIRPYRATTRSPSSLPVTIAIENVAKPGREMWYKNMMLPIPADLQIPTCSNCGEQWMDEVTLNAVDSALEQAYHARLRRLGKK